MKKNLSPAIFFFALSILLVLIWFKSGLLYGGGDVGLPEYNPTRILEIIKFIWWDVSATGFLRPSGITGIPLYYLLSSLAGLGLSYVSIQALIFATVAFLSGFGMYLLAKRYFGQKGAVFAVVSGVFYIFNPFTMVQVWHRFVRPGFYFLAALPWLFILWQIWIKKGKYWSLFAFLVVNSFLAFVFSTLGFVIALWILLGLYALGQIILPWKGKNNFWRLSARFATGLLLWVVVSFWWIYPFLTSGPALLSGQHTIYENVLNVLSLSTQSVVPYSIAGLNPFYLYEVADFGPIYSTIPFLIMPYLLALAIIVGMLVSLRNRRYSFLGLLFLVSLFIAKGTSAPFGHILTWLFEKSFFLGAIRNPFEKLGLIMTIAAAILFSIGVRAILAFGKKGLAKLGSTVLIALLFLSLVAYSWPMWSGKIFGNVNSPAYVEVPQSYLDADKWLVENMTGGRLLHLPLTAGDGITYKWQYGYNGLESSDLLFTSPSIAHAIGFKPLDDIIKGLILMFHQKSEVGDKNLVRFLKALNVEYIVLHKDVSWVSGGWDSPERLEKVIETSPIFSKEKIFGDLSLYKVNYESRGKLFLASTGEYIDFDANNLFWPWIVDDESEVFLSDINKDDETFWQDKFDEILLTPEMVISTPVRQLAFKENARGELPYVRFLPDSPIYSLIRLKEYFELAKQPIQNKFWTRLSFAGKRLIEMDSMATKGDIPSEVVSRYETAVNKSLDELVLRGLGSIQPKDLSIIKKSFANQILILNEMIDGLGQDAEQKQQILELSSNLRVRLADLGLIPYYQGDSLNKYLSRFDVPVSGEYEILVAEQKSSDLYGGLEDLDFLIDENSVNLSAQKQGNFLSYGKVFLDTGLHEIGYERIKSKELGQIQALSEDGQTYRLDTPEHESVSLSWNVSDFRADSLYTVSFDYWVEKGVGPTLQVVQDTDPEDTRKPGQKVRIISERFEPNDYNFYWYSASETFTPRINASSLEVKLVAVPWNNCEKILLERCEEETERMRFDRPSSVVIRNVSITRELTNPVFLRLSNKAEQKISPVEFKKLSPTHYVGSAEISPSSFLVFSETYHPDWVLTLSDSLGNKKKASMQLMADLYANAWYLEKPGDYQFDLEFTPQKRIDKGLAVSIIGGLAAALMVLRQRRKR